KSEILKKVAEFVGITMISLPLSAGELNRPLVGETEKILMNMMNRAKLIPYLICAMTVDEIDGLAPKRDGNAQQSKVDGISVLLSHIEGIKDVPNLIILGATNRRQMMDDAFLRRMQTKCFVGRPSPKTRKKLLIPLMVKNPEIFSTEQLDFLIKITTNFSGAALSLFKGEILSVMNSNMNASIRNDVQIDINQQYLLKVIDRIARDNNIWFGFTTLPEIYQLNASVFDQCQEKYSLVLKDLKPTGRILVDLQDKKIFIEQIQPLYTIEIDLDPTEISLLQLLSRFIHGCLSRNIDTIQVIDRNYLSIHNAFDDKQIFELLYSTLMECDEYNRQMVIFDIDSLIMLNESNSDKTKSISISNISLYQAVREQCKKTFINDNKEKWIVIIVKHPILKNSLCQDIAFNKTEKQIKQEQDDEQQRLNDKKEKKCPKCLNIYQKSEYGNTCNYHDGFLYNLKTNDITTALKASEIVFQAEFEKYVHTNNGENEDDNQNETPKFKWICCLKDFNGTQGNGNGCVRGQCGLPKQLQEAEKSLSDDESIRLVQDYYLNNPSYLQKRIMFTQQQQQQQPHATLTTAAVFSTNRTTTSNII
ncbi:unnamed protein product, partial [Didymodactylos carnosus]